MVTESHRSLVESKNDNDFNAQNEAVDTENNNNVITDDEVYVANNGVPPQMGFFEKWLSVWVLLCMIVGALIGAFAPESARALSQASFAQINAIVAVFLWLMILPMLIQIDFEAIKAVRKVPGAIALTTCINYLVKPFTMYAFAILFFRCLYVGLIPDEALRDEYIAGLILLAAAPCTAMVRIYYSILSFFF